jgi:hypothetical protein
VNLRTAFTEQADNNAALGSPFTARVLRLLATRIAPGTPLTDRLFTWPGNIGSYGASLPLRLLGGLHALALSGQAPGLARVYPPHKAGDEALWQAVSEAMDLHPGLLERWLDNPPQTNEVRRASALIAAGHLLTSRFGLPIVLSELGASAGLNLMWDLYALVLDGKRFGPGDAVLNLAPAWQGPRPPVAAPRIVERRGVDIQPLDPHDPEDALRILSYIWADQPERLDRTRSAMRAATARVDRADAAGWLEHRLSTDRPGRLHIVFHTIAWQYFPPDTQSRCKAALARAGNSATRENPLVHLSMEADGSEGAALEMQIWPEGEKTQLARVDFHGRWIKWQSI